MATDPNTEPYDKGKPNPVDLVSDLSPLGVLAYTHHVILACGEAWQAFADYAKTSGDEIPAWIPDMPAAISAIADGWSEIIETAGANWLEATGERGQEA